MWDTFIKYAITAVILVGSAVMVIWRSTVDAKKQERASNDEARAAEDKAAVEASRAALDRATAARGDVGSDADDRMSDRPWDSSTPTRD